MKDFSEKRELETSVGVGESQQRSLVIGEEGKADRQKSGRIGEKGANEKGEEERKKQEEEHKESKELVKEHE